MSTVDEIKDRINIVDVASGYLTLRKSGSNYKAICPFHKEKTPSFTVNPERQTWRCFGACATGGDVFSFVMRIEQLEFGETLRLLADKTGVTLRSRNVDDSSEGTYRVNLEAVNFYQKILDSPEGDKALTYLQARGVDSKTVSTFQLGMSPPGSTRLKEHLNSLGFDLEVAVKAGLLRKSDSGILRDFFWGRLMFPIHDRQGRVTGLGGRSLDNSHPKYINTAATPVFDKRTTLYGLHLAITPITKKGTAVVVEGYMDAIAAHQFGHTNVVACMGTALTEQQVLRLKSAAKVIVQALDPDVAGQEATLGSLESAYHALERRRLGQRLTLDLRIAQLTGGRDPDQLIRQDPEEWVRVLDEAVPFMDFLIPAKASKYDLSTADGKGQAASALLPVILAEDNSLKQDEYFQTLSVTLGVSRQALEASIGKPPFSNYRPRFRQEPSRGPSIAALEDNRRDLLEDYVLSILLKQPELKEYAEPLTFEHFHKIENKTIFTEWLSCNTMVELRERMDVILHQHLDYLEGLELGPTGADSTEPALIQSVRRMELRHLQKIQEELLSVDDSTMPPSREVEAAVSDVNSRLRKLHAESKETSRINIR